MNIAKRLAFVLSVLLLAACASTPEQKTEQKNASAAADANTQMGVELLRKGDYEQSRAKLEKALQLEPDYAPAHDAIAVLYEKVGETKLAEKHYKRSLKLKPDSSRAHNNYGQFLCFQDRYKEATEQFLKAAENSFYATPEVPLTNAGMCAARIPDIEVASEYYRLALLETPCLDQPCCRWRSSDTNKAIIWVRGVICSDSNRPLLTILKACGWRCVPNSP